MALDSVEGLMYFVQMGVLEFHPWSARIDNLECPDRMIFDLDPGSSAPWKSVVETAVLVRELLAMLGLRSFVKTTGGKGLHVVTPLGRRRNHWDEVKDFSKAVVEQLAQLQPRLYTIRVARSEREGRIYLDYLRNTKGASAVAAYSCRAKAGAPVAVPLTWEELQTGVRSDSFTIAKVRERLRALRSDPWEGFFDLKQSITAPMKRRLGLK